ncbi:hypothetical protein [Pseudoalteromonas rubra]|uniref:hypothetical protein n=1 Tax=Pseudoalteromonas rubra TaxID=43658 RepID=UPI000698FC71|nr:hypothetical protein [Pseudoalteromonas rubra]
MKQVWLLLSLLMLSGCATTYSPIPDNYNGPKSTIGSTEKRHSTSKADMFFLYKVNGKLIDNSLGASRSATYGQGFALTTSHVTTAVPSSEPITLTLVGRTVYAAPVQTLSGTVYEITGDLTFTPTPDVRYVVKGTLDADYSAVWVEETETGKIIKSKIETYENTELGFFEK